MTEKELLKLAKQFHRTRPDLSKDTLGHRIFQHDLIVTIGRYGSAYLGEDWAFSTEFDTAELHFVPEPRPKYASWCTRQIVFHDWEARVVLRNLGNWHGDKSAQDVFPLHFWPFVDKTMTTAVTEDAFITKTYFQHKNGPHERLLYEKRAEREAMELARLSERDLQRAITRMRLCPTFTRMTEAECARILLDGAIDVKGLVEASR